MSFPRYPKYKASGVEWLGEVPEGWEVKRLKHNVRLLTEKTDRRDHPVALENIEGWSGRLIPTETAFEGEGIAFEPGDILFGKLRPYLAKAYLAKSAGEAVGDFHVLRPATGVAGRFTQYQILNREFISIVDGSTFGAKMPRASWEFVGGMKVTRPPLPEQTAIAEFLDRETGKIDELVAEQRRLIELLKEKRQAVISHAVTKGLNPHAPMKPSGVEWLGEVPEGWVVCAPKRRIKSSAGGTLIKGTCADEPSDGLFPGFSASGQNIWLEEYAYDCPAIVLSAVGARCGKTFKADGQWGVVANTHCLFPRSDSDRDYLWYLTNQEDWWEKGGSAQPFVKVSETLARPWVFPPLPEQTAIAEFLDRETGKIDELVAEAQRAIDLLQERRAALISAAVTGQIDVRHQPHN